MPEVTDLDIQHRHPISHLVGLTSGSLDHSLVLLSNLELIIIK